MTAGCCHSAVFGSALCSCGEQSWLCWPANDRSEPRDDFGGRCRALNARFQVQAINLTSAFTILILTSSWFWPTLFSSLDLMQMRSHLKSTTLLCQPKSKHLQRNMWAFERKYDCLVQTQESLGDEMDWEKWAVSTTLNNGNCYDM